MAQKLLLRLYEKVNKSHTCRKNYTIINMLHMLWATCDITPLTCHLYQSVTAQSAVVIALETCIRELPISILTRETS
jgi:hypothetical protein